MNHTSNLISDYLKTVKNGFPVYGRFEKDYLKKLKECIQEYAVEHPSCSKEDIIAEFGTPASVISDYFYNVDDKYLHNKLKIKHLLKRWIIIVILLGVLLDAYCYYLAYQDRVQAENQEIIYETTYIHK